MTSRFHATYYSRNSCFVLDRWRSSNQIVSSAPASASALSQVIKFGKRNRGVAVLTSLNIPIQASDSADLFSTAVVLASDLAPVAVLVVSAGSRKLDQSWSDRPTWDLWHITASHSSLYSLRYQP